MRIIRRVARHGVIGTLKLVPTNLRNYFRKLEASQRAARRRDREFDLRYGTRTSGRIPVGGLDVTGENVDHAVDYEPISPESFNIMMRFVPPDLTNFRFIDYGSGLGRALLLASLYPFKEIIGVEFSALMHRQAERNLRKFRPPERVCSNAKSLLMDAALFSPPPGPTIFFFNNPFGRELMATALQRINNVHRTSASPLYLLYGHPYQQDLLTESPFWAKLSGSGDEWAVFVRANDLNGGAVILDKG